MELVAHLGLPLLGQVRRTEDGEPLYLALVDQLSGHEERLYGLPDSDVVSDEKAQRIELEPMSSGTSWYAGVDGDAPEGAEGAGARAKGQPERIAQESAGVEVSDVGRVRGAKVAGSIVSSSVRMPAISSSVPPSGRRTRNVVVRLGQHDPLAAARPTREPTAWFIGRRFSWPHSGSAG